MRGMSYRPEIDGLRALAVLPVVLYHAGLSWLPGGFMGVDVFFVISGYLITKIIWNELQSEQFGLGSFYERRFRRIIPALLAVVLFVLLFSLYAALPSQLVDTSRSAIAALLSISNFHFWTQTGYFSPAVEFMPLLHTWSLAVEEQFYLFFPLMLLGARALSLSVRKLFLIALPML
ncbi:MAG: acyltransferase family protein, partial [Nitrospira sp.]